MLLHLCCRIKLFFPYLHNRFFTENKTTSLINATDNKDICYYREKPMNVMNMHMYLVNN